MDRLAINCWWKGGPEMFAAVGRRPEVDWPLGASINAVDTPAVLVDVDRLEANIQAMAQLAATAHLQVSIDNQVASRQRHRANSGYFRSARTVGFEPTPPALETGCSPRSTFLLVLSP